MTISHATIIEWAETQKRQKFTWLEDHGPRSKRPRPETEAENKPRDIAMLDAVITICDATAAAWARGGQA